MTTEEMKKQWVTIGKKNLWIKEANDPPFTIREVHEKKTIKDLYDHFQHGNWCLGDAPYYQNLCFINQVDGGSEYMVIKDQTSFESLSADLFTLEKLTDFIERAQKATVEQLRMLEY